MNKNIKMVLIIGGVVLGGFIALSLLSGPICGWRVAGWRSYGVCPIGGFGMGRGWFGPVLMVFFWGLVLWVVVSLVRRRSCFSGVDSGSARPDSALEVLKKRYAVGEISKEEYEEKRNDIL